MFSRVSEYRFAPLLGLTILCISCGKAGHDRFEVRGLVTLDGKPLPSGMIITFTPKESARPVARGGTDMQSRYAMYAEQGKIGLYPGTYAVSVELPYADEPGPYSGPPELATIQIPPAYQTGKSTLTFTVPADGSTFDIVMKSE